MNKLVVLGSDGQLGSDLLEVCQDREAISIVPLTIEDIDLTNLEKIGNYLESLLPFDYLINCAAMTDTGLCETKTTLAYTINGLAVFEMAKFCNHHNIKFFQISTDYVFDGTKNVPYVESDRVAPINIYGASKLTGEELIVPYHDKYFIFRVASLFGKQGALGKGGNFIENMINLSKKRDELRVIDDIIMSPTHSYDVAKGIVSFVENSVEEYGTYHCTGPNGCSWYEFTKEIFSLIGCSIKVLPVSHSEYPSNLNRPLYSVMSNDLITKYYKMPSWQETLKVYLERKQHIC